MNVSGISLKEAMDAIEERIPHGRKVITSLLMVAIIASFAALVRFLYSDLLLPILAWAASWWATPLPIKLQAATIADVIVCVLLLVMVWLVVNYLLKKAERRFEPWFELLRDIPIAKVLAAYNELSDKLDAMDRRISALESHSRHDTNSRNDQM